MRTGRSEDLIGGYVAERKLRDELILATKFTFHGGKTGNPNAGGNGRKHIYRALESSLRRLRTDYVDLYWLHAWDLGKPIEEVLQTLGDLVRAGKIRYSDSLTCPLGTPMFTEDMKRGIFGGATVRGLAVAASTRRMPEPPRLFQLPGKAGRCGSPRSPSLLTIRPQI